MTTEQQPQARRQRPRPVMRTVEVQSTQKLTPHLIRVALTGAELDGFTSRGPAEHIRIWFPKPGDDRPIVVPRDENGRFPDGVVPPPSRVYTPRRWHEASKTLEVDFVLHDGPDDGPGASWVRGARAGNVVIVAGPSGPYIPDPDAAWYVIAGDHAGLPAVATILEALPAGKRADVYVEVPEAEDEIELLSPAMLHVTWIHGGHEAPAQALASAFKTIELPEGDGRVFVACEAGAMREIKRHLLHDRGLNREQLYTHGYWQRGEANHPDHDLAPEI